jgi:hypothetical protein
MNANKPPVKSIVSAAALAVLMSLATCGGGGSSSAAAGGGSGGGGGTLTIAAATPAANNTTLDLSNATTNGNDTRAADGFSSTPYCEVFFEGFSGANGTTYSLQVYFRQSHAAALHATIVGGNPPTFIVFDNAAGNPITGITVDTAARTINFSNKVLSGSSGEVVTVNGSRTFPGNSGTPACGA